MNQIFDVYTLVFLVVAIFIFLRLRNVLGRRTGNERTPFERLGDGERNEKAAGSDDDKVVAMPRRDGAASPFPDIDEDDDIFRWNGIAEPGSKLATELDAIRAADSTFEARSFLDGAQRAYEMIVTAFAEGDRKTLRPLLSPDVYDGFVQAISDRETRGEIVESRFIGIDSADIESAEVKGGAANVMVRFKSALVTVTRNKDGGVIDGDPKAVSDVNDVWTFSRLIAARDPNWQLVATESA